MLRSLFFTAIICLLAFTLATCKKGHDSPAPPQPQPDPGTFKLTFNNQTWTAPERHRVTYFPKRQEIYLNASGDTTTYYCGIKLDPANITKTYVLQSNGTNLASWTKDDFYSTLFNAADIGGSFTITKFDTIQKKFSATFNYVAYSLDRKKRTVIQSVDVTDLPININDTATYTDNVAQCTFVGAQTSTWDTKNITSAINCWVTDGRATYKVMTVRLNSIGSTRRHLEFNIPIWFKAGIYPITQSYFNTCDELRIFARFGYYENAYYSYPTSGNMEIVKIDTFAKSMQTNFNFVIRDTLFKENIQITNGKMQIKW